MIVFDRQHRSAEVAIEEPGQVGRSLVEQGLGKKTGAPVGLVVKSSWEVDDDA
jgi:hypothetical protein